MSTPPEGVWLLRHGKTKLNSTDPDKDLIRGWRNVPLDAEGQREAKEAVAFTRDKIKPEIIYSSDLDRAADIAKEAAKVCDCPLKVTKDFRPWGLGTFQGKPAKEVVPQLQQYIDHPEKPVPGGGESFNDFRGRVLKATKKAMDRHLESGLNVAIVTHFRDLKLIQAWLAQGGDTDDIDAKVFAANDIPTGGALRVYRERGRWKAKIETQTKVGVKRG